VSFLSGRYRGSLFFSSWLDARWSFSPPILFFLAAIRRYGFFFPFSHLSHELSTPLLRTLNCQGEPPFPPLASEKGVFHLGGAFYPLRDKCSPSASSFSLSTRWKKTTFGGHDRGETPSPFVRAGKRTQNPIFFFPPFAGREENAFLSPSNHDGKNFFLSTPRRPCPLRVLSSFSRGKMSFTEEKVSGVPFSLPRLFEKLYPPGNRSHLSF